MSAAAGLRRLGGPARPSALDIGCAARILSVADAATTGRRAAATPHVRRD